MLLPVLAPLPGPVPRPKLEFEPVVRLKLGLALRLELMPVPRPELGPGLMPVPLPGLVLVLVLVLVLKHRPPPRLVIQLMLEPALAVRPVAIVPLVERHQEQQLAVARQLQRQQLLMLGQSRPVARPGLALE